MLRMYTVFEVMYYMKVRAELYVKAQWESLGSRAIAEMMYAE